MKIVWGLTLLVSAGTALAQSGNSLKRSEAEYYVAAYAQHYRVPVPLVRAIVERESNWRPCAISSKGAVGLMQLMPMTARNLRVSDPCNIDQNISGGVRYLAWLIQKFHGDLRLASAAYYAGENIVSRRGLAYRNPDVVAYVSRMRATYLRFAQEKTEISETIQERDIR
ncbi:MAG: lytic transglycosylase domain-containing protein [Terriglobales bacterium]